MEDDKGGAFYAANKKRGRKFDTTLEELKVIEDALETVTMGKGLNNNWQSSQTSTVWNRSSGNERTVGRKP